MRVILVGFGVVGGGLAEQISRRSRETGRGSEFRLVAAIDSGGAVVNRGGLDPAELLARKRKGGRVGNGARSATEVIREVEADVAVELTPGTMDGEPATSHIKAALQSGKSVVTANKMPLALHYSELLREAEKRNVRLLYGACVGGGLPVLDFGKVISSVEPVDRIEGVLNATTNFILTEMERGESYAQALRDAQRLGYAETDPRFDTGGIDAACKIVILANHVMGRDFRLRDVKPLAGIGRVTTARVRRAKKSGRLLRLVALAGRGLGVGVSEVEGTSPLAVEGRSHAVLFHCRYSGERAIIGSGAGSVTTSLGVMRDLVTLSHEIGT